MQEGRLWTGLGVVVVLAAMLHALRFQFRQDDAYIAFAYARNLVHGHGLVFNVGERVEGYTCFLWVMLSALGLALGFDIAVWSQAWCLLAIAGTVAATWCLGRVLLPPSHRAAAVMGALVVAAYPPLAWWAGSRMETVLFTCWLTAALALHARRGARSLAAPFCLVAAMMTRPEGWLLAVLLCADALRRGPRAQAWRYVGIVVALFAPYYLWRFWYYGYPLPNTFYAKVGTSGRQFERGLVYTVRFAQHPSTWWLLGCAALAPWRRWPGVLGVFVVAYMAYVVLVGGDVFDYHRFFVPVVPLLAVAATAGVIRLVEHRRSAAVSRAVVGATLLFLLACVPMERAQKLDMHLVRIVNALLERPCASILRHTAPTDSLAAIGVGRLKYCTDRRVIDLVGLTDAHIAHRTLPEMGSGLPGHEKYDADYVLRQRPAYIFIPNRAQSSPGQIPAVRTLWAHPDLDRLYVAESEGPVSWYRRRDMPPLATPPG